MSQTVVIDGEITLKSRIDGEINLRSMIDGDLGMVFVAGASESESGEWTTDVRNTYATIDFTKAHTDPPIFAAICDTSNDAPPSQAVVLSKEVIIFSNRDAFGVNLPNSVTGLAISAWERLNEGMFVTAEEITDRGQQFLTNTQAIFRSDQGDFVPNRTYKWIAIWKAEES